MQFTAAQHSFLDQPWVCVLATVGPGGTPHAAPMWYVRDGDTLLMLTGVDSQKQRNMERDRRVSVVVDTKQRPYYALMIGGVVEFDDTPVTEIRGRFAERYLTSTDAAAFLESRRGVPATVFRVLPENLVEYGSPPA